MMITPDKVFAHLDRIQGWRNGDKPAPVTIEWDLSNRCSRGCQGCHMAYTHARGPLAGAHDGPVGSTPTGDLADTDLVIRALEQARAAGVQGIVWSGGGEPTLHPDFDRITESASELGFDQGMYTHGGHIHEWRGFQLARRFTWVVVSLDRADAESYRAYKGGGMRGFERACQGIKNLVGGPCTVGVSLLLDADTWRDMPQAISLTHALGADYVTFRPMISFDQANPAEPTDDRSWITEALPTLRAAGTTPGVVCDVDRFLEYRDWTARSYHACMGIRLNTTITPDGRVWLCPNRRGFAGSSLGDLNQESFQDIWARHPGQWTDFEQCRVMCRLHLVNERMAMIETPMEHASFI